MGGFFDDAPASNKSRVVSLSRKVFIAKIAPLARSTSISARPQGSEKGAKKRSRPEASSSSSSSNAARRAEVDSEARVKKARRKEQDLRVRPESDSEGSDSASEATASAKRARALEGDETVGREIFAHELAPPEACEGFSRGEDLVRPMLDKYVAFFPQSGFENVEPVPSVELAYPSSTTCREKFILLVPRSSKAGAREYSPIAELMRAIHTIVFHYIPASHVHLFGPLPSDDLMSNMAPVTPQRNSPLPSSPCTPGTPVKTAVSSASLPHDAVETILRALHKSINRHDGPGFVAAVSRFNEALDSIRADGGIARQMEAMDWGKMMKLSDWEELVDFVHDQAYSRVVGPFSNALEHPIIPDGVSVTDKEGAYGELRHRFMSKIIQQTKLGPNSTFVDLGSGVGNCVLQAALQAGCASYGWELLPVPAKCGALQIAEVKKRWAMWGLVGDQDVHTFEGDFRDPSVAKKLKEADVVLVNNEVFPSSLNHDLTHLFLELRDGSIVVSLKPFQPEGFRMNDSNCDSFAAILRLKAYDYQNDWVSWKSGADKYYVQVIDRSMREKYERDSKRRRA